MGWELETWTRRRFPFFGTGVVHVFVQHTDDGGFPPENLGWLVWFGWGKLNFMLLLSHLESHSESVSSWYRTKLEFKAIFRSQRDCWERGWEITKGHDDSQCGVRMMLLLNRAVSTTLKVMWWVSTWKLVILFYFC